MSQPQPLIFSGISAALFAQLKAKAIAAGIAFSDDGGTASYSGCHFAFSYNTVTQVLTIAITAKPFYIPTETITSKLTALVSAAKSAQQA